MKENYAEMTLGQVMDLYPQTWGLFRQMGVCCVYDENINSSVAQLCRENNAELESFLDVFMELI